MTWIETVIIAIVEGLTEFLPVSSTGHMIIAQNLLGLTPDALNETDKALIGLLAKKSGLLDWLLDSVLVVAIMLVVGGVFMLFCDKLFNKGSDQNKVNEKRAFNIGLYQCISVIPGVSRSMATIVGGMTQGLTRQRAAEFSFFLAVPTMAGATLLDLLDLLKEDASWATTHNITMLILGCVVAFIVALLAMKWFVAFLTKYGFKAFGYYRIIVGGIILVMLLTGHSLAMVD